MKHLLRECEKGRRERDVFREALGTVSEVARATGVIGLAAGLLASACVSERPSSVPSTGISPSEESSDPEEIRETFNDYKAGVLDRDGAAASSLISSETLDYYDDIRQLAATAGPKKIGQQSIANKFLVTRARLEVGANRLKKMTGKELFEYGVRKSWISEGATVRQELGDIAVSGDVANAEVNGGGPTSYDFFRENGEWKLDFIAILRSFNVFLQSQASESGQPDDEYLFLLLESITGKSVPRSIWRKP